MLTQHKLSFALASETSKWKSLRETFVFLSETEIKQMKNIEKLYAFPYVGKWLKTQTENVKINCNKYSYRIANKNIKHSTHTVLLNSLKFSKEFYASNCKRN